MSNGLKAILVIAIAVFVGKLIANQIMKPKPAEAVKQAISSGDPVRDFLDNF
jgi:hypothetical protein